MVMCGEGVVAHGAYPVTFALPYLAKQAIAPWRCGTTSSYPPPLLRYRAVVMAQGTLLNKYNKFCDARALLYYYLIARIIFNDFFSHFEVLFCIC